MKTRLGLGVTAVIAAVLASTAAGSTAARPGVFRGSGTIVLSCTGCPGSLSDAQLVTVSASGRGFRTVRTRALNPVYPRWSPDGRSVAVASRSTEIWRASVRPQGRGLQLTRQCRGCRGDNYPAWSPDGRKIVFVRENMLYTVRAFNGTQPRELNTWRLGSFGSPDWSPDGSRIVFNHWGSGLYIVRSDGSRARRVDRSNMDARYPRWSPDGKRIAFIGQVGGGYAVMVIRPDGTGLRVLARPRSLNFSVNPAWSPDGRHVLFAVKIRLGSSDHFAHQLWIATLRGGPLRRIAIPQLPRDRAAEIHGIDWTSRALSS